MRIIVKLFSLVVVIVKSQSSQSRSHFSRSGYHRWCPFNSLNVPESSHILPSTRSVPPDLQRFITQRSPRTCICSSLRAEREQWFFRKISPTVLRKSPQLSSILHALLPMFSSPLLSFSQLQFCIIYMVVWLTLSQDHKLEKGLLLFCGSLCLHGVWSRAWCSMGICWMTMTVILLCFCLGDGSFKRLLNWAEIWLTSSTWGPASSHTSCM